MNKDIKDISDVELKAVAFDSLKEIERLQQQIQFINQELNNRAQAGAAKVEQAPVLEKDAVPKDKKSK